METDLWLDRSTTEKLLVALENQIDVQRDDNKLLLWEGQEKVATLHLPLQYALSAQNAFKDIEWHSLTLFVALIQAGQAALGVIENEELSEHKVLRRYMVRKKQGKAQLSYLKTKGKSRAGSRIRLANTELFIEDIHTKLIAWQTQYTMDRLAMQCPPPLRGLLNDFNGKRAFDRKDARIVTVPISIPDPNLKGLKKVQYFAPKSRLVISQKNAILSKLLSNV